VLTIRIVSCVIAVAMAISIAVGFATADFGTDGRALLELTWGVITLVDIYSAFTMLWLWIAWRESDVLKAVIWLVLVVTLGSLSIAVYVAMAAFRAGTPQELLLGTRRSRDTLAVPL
jgi:hypothetical protein